MSLKYGSLQHSCTPVCLCEKSIEEISYGQSIPTKNSNDHHALEKDIDPFRLKQEGEEVLGAKYTYLNDIGALMYLTNNTRSDIIFVVNYLSRYCAAPTIRH
jgi:hypothetical protein